MVEPRQRLGVPNTVADDLCPQCQGVMDQHFWHARTCGRRRADPLLQCTERHCLFLGGRAGMRERPALLLPLRPGLSLGSRPSRRRVLPSLKGSPDALDFAVVPPQRQGTLAQAGQVALAAAAASSQTKDMHLDTGRVCAQQGVQFRPMVCETTGAWLRKAAAILLLISKAVAVRLQEEASWPVLPGAQRGGAKPPSSHNPAPRAELAASCGASYTNFIWMCIKRRSGKGGGSWPGPADDR